jgi:5-methylcytosine-specific restriction endonuclease McrA
MVSRAVEKRLYEIYNHRCALCCKRTDFAEGHVDHIKPRSKGGSDNLKNLQWLCSTCNLEKGNRYTNRQVAKRLGLQYPPKCIEERKDAITELLKKLDKSITEGLVK